METTLCVTGIANEMSVTDINAKLREFGPIRSTKILHEKRCAFVDFQDIDSAIKAYQQRGFRILDTDCKVDWGSNMNTDRPRGLREEQYNACNILFVSSGVSEQVVEAAHVFGRVESLREAGGSLEIVYSETQSAVDFFYIFKGARVNNTDISVEFVESAGFGDQIYTPSIPEPVEFEKAESGSNSPDRALVDRIAYDVANGGPEYSNRLLQEEQNGNKSLSFMKRGNSGYNYYSWRLWCLYSNISQSMEDFLLKTYASGHHVGKKDEVKIKHIIDDLNVGNIADHKKTVQKRNRYTPLVRRLLPTSERDAKAKNAKQLEKYSKNELNHIMDVYYSYSGKIEHDKRKDESRGSARRRRQ